MICDLIFPTDSHSFLSPHLAIAKHQNSRCFTNLLKWKYIFWEGERGLVCLQIKRGSNSSAIVFIPHNVDWVENQFDLLFGLGEDTLFAWGTGYIEAGWGIGDILSMARSEQPRLVKVGERALQWDMARGFWV